MHIPCPFHFHLIFFKQQVCLILPMSLEPHGVAGGGNGSRGCSQASTQALNSLVLPRTSGVTSILQVGKPRLPEGGQLARSRPERHERRQPQSLGAQHAVRGGRAGPSGPGRGPALSCRTVLGGSGPQPWVYFCLLLLPSLAFLLGGPSPTPHRGQGPEFGDRVWLHASFLEKEPSPQAPGRAPLPPCLGSALAPG